MEITCRGSVTNARFKHPIEAIDWLETQRRDKSEEKRARRAANGSYGWDLNSEDHSYHYQDKRDFNQYADYSDIKKLALTGWQVGTDDIVSQVTDIKHAEMDMLKGYAMDVEGQFFDIGMVISGEPECWFKPAKKPVKKVVSICVNIAGSGGVDASSLARRGAAILALVDRLQELNYIVELTAVCGAEHADNKNISFAWFEFGTTPLDIDAAALTLAHTGWFRVACFALTECCGGGDPGQYYCKELDRDERKKFNIYIPSGDIRNKDGQTLNSAKDAAVWVQDQIEKISAI
jgi:hypothetical protein